MAQKGSYRIDPDATLPVGGHSALSRLRSNPHERRTGLSCRPDGVRGTRSPGERDLLEAKSPRLRLLCPCGGRGERAKRFSCSRSENIRDATDILRLLSATDAGPRRILRLHVPPIVLKGKHVARPIAGRRATATACRRLPGTPKCRVSAQGLAYYALPDRLRPSTGNLNRLTAVQLGCYRRLRILSYASTHEKLCHTQLRPDAQAACSRGFAVSCRVVLMLGAASVGLRSPVQRREASCRRDDGGSLRHREAA